jgi:hypothetical protein
VPDPASIHHRRPPGSGQLGAILPKWVGPWDSRQPQEVGSLAHILSFLIATSMF